MELAVRAVDVTRLDFQLNAPESQEVLFCPVAGSKCPSRLWSNLCRIKSAHLSRHSSVTRTRHTFNFEHPFAVPVVEDSRRSIPRIGLTVLATCNKVSIYLSIHRLHAGVYTISPWVVRSYSTMIGHKAVSDALRAPLRSPEETPSN